MVAQEQDLKLIECEASKKDADSEREKIFDASEARIHAAKKWPELPEFDFTGTKSISRSTWSKLQKNEWVLTHAHLLCLTEGPAKSKLSQLVAQVSSAKSEYGKRWAMPFIKAGAKFSPWTARASNRYTVHCWAQTADGKKNTEKALVDYF